MAFMQMEITGKQKWLRLDTRNEGIVVYPASMFSAEWAAEQHGVEVEEVETVEGFGGRMSAPGYMDCTEWCVYDSAEEAGADLESMYGDDEEEEG